MGADMTVSWIPSVEWTEERKAAFLELLRTGISDEDMLSIAGDLGRFDSEEDDALVKECREYLVQIAQDELFTMDNRRDVTYISRGVLHTYPILITGGLSWGDAPTEAYNLFDDFGHVFSAYGLMEQWAKEDCTKPDLDQEYEIVYVDFPQWNDPGCLNAAGLPIDKAVSSADWGKVAQFTTKRQAVEWVRSVLGQCDDDGNVCLITTGTPKEDYANEVPAAAAQSECGHRMVSYTEDGRKYTACRDCGLIVPGDEDEPLTPLNG